MWKNVVLLIIVGFILMLGCSGSTDQSRVSSILRNTAYWAKTADAEFKASMDSIDSLQAGRPMYQVADLLKQHYEQLDQSTRQIARPYEHEVKEIKNAKARDLMRKGVESFHLVYDQKRTFVGEAQAALNQNDTNGFLTAAKKHAGNSRTEMAKLMVGISFFYEAKKALGMPLTVDEFKQ